MDNIFYLVVQEGANVSLTALQGAVQSMLDQNDINMTVQFMTVGDDGFGDTDFKSMLDDTDALTFIGSESFVENIAGNKEIGFGWTDDRVGYINLDGMHQAVERNGLETEHIARGSIHEGLGHAFLGRGHPDEAYPPGIHPKRYSKSRGGGGYRGAGEQNIMTSGNGTKWSENPFENGGGMFLPEDKRAINNQINLGNISGVKRDNFSKRIKG